MNTIVKMILPAAVFVLASAGAVSTQAAKANAPKKAFATEWIQLNNNPFDCEAREVTNCDEATTANACTADFDNKQVYRLDSASGQCNIVLYKQN